MDVLERLDELARIEGRDLQAEMYWWADQIDDLRVEDATREWNRLRASFETLGNRIALLRANKPSPLALPSSPRPTLIFFEDPEPILKRVLGFIVSFFKAAGDA